jgi:hypothetical protein
VKNKPRKLTIAEQFEHHQMTRVLRYWFQRAAAESRPAAALHESLQPIADSNEFENFDWEIIDTALEDVLCHRQTFQGAASKAALQITGLSVSQRL